METHCINFCQVDMIREKVLCERGERDYQNPSLYDVYFRIFAFQELGLKAICDPIKVAQCLLMKCTPINAEFITKFAN